MNDAARDGRRRGSTSDDHRPRDCASQGFTGPSRFARTNPIASGATLRRSCHPAGRSSGSGRLSDQPSRPSTQGSGQLNDPKPKMSFTAARPRRLFTAFPTSLVRHGLATGFAAAHGARARYHVKSEIQPGGNGARWSVTTSRSCPCALISPPSTRCSPTGSSIRDVSCRIRVPNRSANDRLAR